MKRSFLVQVALGLFILALGLSSGVLIRHNKTTWSFVKDKVKSGYNPFDDTRKGIWDKDFKVIKILSSKDNAEQRAYFYHTRSSTLRPLIVSLHSWSGSYYQEDPIATLARENDINYIRPDFRGPNNSPNACCSDLAIGDIDDAIDYALKQTNVDPDKVYVIGGSGGGYAAVSAFMHSRHKVAKFVAWNPITDLISWYHESKIKGNKYADDILACTASVKDSLNIATAVQRSPLYGNVPLEKLNYTKLYIYTGAYDGLIGAVSPAHSINFYNKLAAALHADSSSYVSDREKLQLLEKRERLNNYGLLNDREIFLIKECNNIKLTVFQGGHEVIWDYAFRRLIEG